jgi:hypothetical protein
MIVGGVDDLVQPSFADGAAYDPEADRWRVLAAATGLRASGPGARCSSAADLAAGTRQAEGLPNKLEAGRSSGSAHLGRQLPPALAHPAETREAVRQRPTPPRNPYTRDANGTFFLAWRARSSPVTPLQGSGWRGSS